MATDILYATADQGTINIVNETDESSPLFSSIDDDPASPNDADWINNIGPGIDGYMDFLSTAARAILADESGLDLTGDGEWRFDLAPSDWTPGVVSYICDRYVTTGNQRVWRVQIATNGVINLATADSSGIFRTTFSLQWDTSGVPSDGERWQIRITLDADNGSGSTVVTLYSRPGTDGLDLESNIGWVQENQDTLAGVQTWLTDATAAVTVHSNTEAGSPGANGIIGKFYRGILWSDLTKTTKVFDLDFTDGDEIVGGDETVWDDPVRTGNWAIQGGANAIWVDNFTGEAWFDLTDLPTDFGTMDAIEIVARWRGQNFGSGTVTLYARIYESDETTPLTDEETVTTSTANTSFANTSPIVFSTVEPADETIWNGARIRFRWVTS